MLIDIVNTYLSLRRTAGFKLKGTEKYLWSYAIFAAERGDQYIVNKTAIDWAAVSHSEGQRANRLNFLIRFARFTHAEDKRHEIPSKNVFCSRKQRRPMKKLNSWYCKQNSLALPKDCDRILIVRSLGCLLPPE